MGIDSIPTNPSNQLVTSRKGADMNEARGDAEKVRQATGDTKSRDDTLTLSKMASILTSSFEGQAFGEVVDPQRVERVRAAIESGNYQVNAKDVAQKLLGIETKLPR